MKRPKANNAKNHIVAIEQNKNQIIIFLSPLKFHSVWVVNEQASYVFGSPDN